MISQPNDGLLIKRVDGDVPLSAIEDALEKYRAGGAERGTDYTQHYVIYYFPEVRAN